MSNAANQHDRGSGSDPQGNEESLRLFENPFLERMTRVQPWVPMVVWIPIISFLIVRALWVEQLSVSMFTGLAVGGFFSWTLVEYWLHRFVFHYRARSRIGKRFVYLFHGNHHDAPNDPTRLLMPPLPGLLIASVLYVIFSSLLGPVFVQPFMAFLLIGYLCYDYTHFAAHHFQPATFFGRMVKQNHMLHHYSCSESRFGVSSPFWDYVFGTAQRRSVLPATPGVEEPRS